MKADHRRADRQSTRWRWRLVIVLVLGCIGSGTYVAWQAFTQRGPLDIPGLVDVEVVDGELWDLQVSPDLGRFHITLNERRPRGSQYQVHCADWAASVMPESMGGNLDG